MYTIIKGADLGSENYVGGRIAWNPSLAESTLGHLENSSNFLNDDRNILIDYTTKSASPEYIFPTQYQDKTQESCNGHQGSMVIKYRDKTLSSADNSNIKPNLRNVENERVSSIFSRVNSDQTQTLFYSGNDKTQYKEKAESFHQYEHFEPNLNHLRGVDSNIMNRDLDQVQRKICYENSVNESKKELFSSRIKLLSSELSLNNSSTSVVKLNETNHISPQISKSHCMKQNYRHSSTHSEDESELLHSMDVYKFKYKTDYNDINTVLNSREFQKYHPLPIHQNSSKIVSPIVHTDQVQFRAENSIIVNQNNCDIAQSTMPSKSNLNECAPYILAQKNLLIRNGLNQDQRLAEDTFRISDSNHSGESSSQWTDPDSVMYNIPLQCLTSQESMRLKNELSSYISQKQFPLRSSHVSINEEEQLKNSEKEITPSFDPSKELGRHSEGLTHTEELSPIVMSSNIREYQEPRLHVNENDLSSYDIEESKRRQLLSVVQLNLPLKNVPTLLETALKGFSSESQDVNNLISSMPHRTIIHSTSQNPSHSFLGSVKQKNFSIEDYRQLLPEEAQLEPLAHQQEDMQVLDFRLRDNESSSSHDTSADACPQNLTFHSVFKHEEDRSNLKNNSGTSLESANTKQNHMSVISLVRGDCKVCNTCRKFYQDHGYLNEDEACMLCLYHAENEMQCVCHDSVIKYETCTCHITKHYLCSYCDEVFSSISLLQKHTFTHISEEGAVINMQTLPSESINCPICPTSFLNLKSLENHILSTHQEKFCGMCKQIFQLFNPSRHSCDAKYICSLCGASFSNQYNLKMHSLKHSGNLPCECQECDKSFAKPSELLKHSLVHSGEKPFSCDKCNMCFSNSQNLRSHKSTHSGAKPHPCKICHKTFTRPADVRRHMLIHSGERPYACEICGLAFADASNMKKHVVTHSKPLQTCDIKTYHCTYCSKVFMRPSELKRHFFTHTKTRPYSCHVCGLAFADSSNLKKHIQTHEKASQHVCVQCESSFKSFEELELHITLSHSSKNYDPNKGYVCVSCNAIFTQLIDLQDHQLTHGPTPSHPCDICSKTFSEKIFLDRHLLTHTESRPYVCDECFKSFKSLSHLRSHVLIHSGVKTHVCHVCDKSFLKKSSLLRHHGVHSKEKQLNNSQNIADPGQV